MLDATPSHPYTRGSKWAFEKGILSVLLGMVTKTHTWADDCDVLLGASSSTAASIFSSACESATWLRRRCSSPTVLLWECTGLFNSIHMPFAIAVA